MIHIAETTYFRSIAAVVRDTNRGSKDPETVRRIVSLSEELRKRTSNTGRVSWWYPYEDAVVINNVMK